jgi:hypothetical protein
MIAMLAVLLLQDETLTVLRTADLTETGEHFMSAATTVAPFDEAVLSWNAKGAWQFDLRAMIGTTWSPWCAMGRLDGTKQASVKANYDGVVIDIDTFCVKGDARATAFQVRVKGKGEIRALAVAHYRKKTSAASDERSEAWGRTLDVPARSQTVEDASIRGKICSPTSVSMALEYFGVKKKTADIAEAVYDHEAKIYGNWPCNTQVAADLLGGEAYVVKMQNFRAVEEEIGAGRPVVLSHRWNKGDLTNAPIESSDGHLIVVVGFTKDGDVVVNDPAAKPDAVRRTYKRAELFRTWQQRAGGIVYVFRPRK